MAIQMKPETRAAILPHAQTLADGAGMVWKAARDGYLAARTEFDKPSAAAAAVRSIIVGDLKGSDGSCRGYLSTLTWLESNGHTVTSALSCGEADRLRYPDKYAPKVDKNDPAAVLADAKAKAAAKIKKLEDAVIADAEARENETDRQKALRAIATILGKMADADLYNVLALLTDAEPADATESATGTNG